MSFRVRFLVPFLLAAAAPLAAQRIIEVTGGGTALQRAISGAMPGDVLLVRPGLYRGVIVTIGIAIVNDPGVIIEPDFIQYPLQVRDLPAGQTFRMRRGELAGGGSFFPHPIDLVSNHGGVILENVQVSDQSRLHTVVHDCENVSFRNCTLFAVDARSSNLTLTGCAMSGFGHGPYRLPPSREHEGLSAIDSHVTISGGDIRGGWGFAGLGSPGIWMQNSTATITGGASIAANELLTGAEAIRTVEGGSLTIDPSVRLITTAADAITGPATVRMGAVPSIQAQRAASGQLLTVWTNAEPGSLIVVLVDAPHTPVRTPIGDLWVTPSATLLDGGYMPASGQRVYNFLLPPLPNAWPATLQVFGLSTSGQFAIGSALGLTVN